MIKGYQSERTGAEVDRLLDKIKNLNIVPSKLATKEELGQKQDIISDLAEIRAGAAKGATALQEHQDISNLATKDEVTQGLRKKVEKSQVGELNLALVDGLDNGNMAYALPDSANGDEDDILLSRNSVKTINSQSIFGSGNITIKEYNDTTLVNRVAAVEASVSSKANTNGVYPGMSVGLAEDLGGRPFFEDAEFVFRASAGEDYSIKDGLATIKEIKGNSVVWNQKSGIASIPYSTASLPIGESIIAGHIYIISANKIANCRLYLYTNDGSGREVAQTTSSTLFTSAYSATSNGNIGVGGLWWYVADLSSEARVLEYPLLYDLTQMFGAGNEPTTIEEFYARIPSGVDMNAYNAGEVIHMNTESIKSVGENAWDGEWELGDVSGSTGVEFDSSLTWRNKGYIRILPNENYYIQSSARSFLRARFYDADKNFIGIVSADNNDVYTNETFKTAANAHYMRFAPNTSVIAQGSQLCVSLVHSGWKQDVDAGYQPYWEDRLDLSVIGKYFPQGMKKAGSAYDEIRFNKASGKWEAVQRIGGVDMGTMTWGIDSLGFAYTHPTIHAIVDSSGLSRNVICSRLGVKQEYYWEATTNDVVMLAEYGKIFITGNILTDTTPAELQDKLKGIILYYELAEPIITEIAEDIELIYDVADFGTEEAIASVPSTPFRARIMYDFNANDSIRNNSVTIRELKKIIAELTNRINSLESNQQ